MGGMQRDNTDWTGVAFGISLACLIAFQQFKLPPVLPGMIAAYGWDRTLAGGFMAVYAVAGLAFSLPIGRAMQRRGIMGMLFGSLALLILGNLLTLALPAAGLVVLLARGLEGIAFAVGAIAGPALASRSAAPRDLGFVVGLMAAWIPIGQLVATGLALVMARWQWIWLLGIAITLLLGIWALALRRHDAFAAPGEAGRAHGHMTPRHRAELTAAASIFLLWSMQYFAYMTWLPQYLVEVTGLGSMGAAAAYALPVAVLLGFNILTGFLLGAGVPLAALLLSALVSQAAVWWLIPWCQGIAAGTALLVLYGIGAGITPTCLFALPGAIMGRAGAPTAFGFIMTGRNIGVFLGPILLAEATKLLGGWSAAWPLFGTTTLAATLVAAILVVMLRVSRRAAAAESI
jgi:MFS family permease